MSACSSQCLAHSSYGRTCVNLWHAQERLAFLGLRHSQWEMICRQIFIPYKLIWSSDIGDGFIQSPKWSDEISRDTDEADGGGWSRQFWNLSTRNGWNLKASTTELITKLISPMAAATWRSYYIVLPWSNLLFLLRWLQSYHKIWSPIGNLLRSIILPEMPGAHPNMHDPMYFCVTIVVYIMA